MAIPPNIDCSCGEIVHPDQPNVVPDMDARLWHEVDGDWHQVRTDMSEQRLSAKDLRAAAVAVRRVARLEGDSDALAALAHRLESVADEPGLKDAGVTVRAWVRQQNGE